MPLSDEVNATTLSYWECALLRLLSTPSVTGHEQGVALVLEDLLKARFEGAHVFRQDVGGGRWNIIMERGAPKITVTTHIDTVPGGPTPSFSATEICGRGACDAKGQVIAQLWGLERAIAAGLQAYRCAFVVGEELDAIGARALLDLPSTEYLLNGEPTENRFVRRGWGVHEVEVSAEGISAHSSLGTAHSAVHILVQELSDLLRHQSEDISVNIGTIVGGVAPNIQAPSASCILCARVRQEPDDFEALLNRQLVQCSWKARFPGTRGVELFVPALYTGPDIEVKFASDCSVYTNRYDAVMLFGPGRIEDAHTENESISRLALRDAAHIIGDLLRELSGHGCIEPRRALVSPHSA
jgi:acetylornithine deacetylase